ncbi:MAG: RnfABCDGE type electron transport complex subunit D [Thermodesulfobacteriota bacterium]
MNQPVPSTAEAAATPVLHVAHSPHIHTEGVTTRRMMFDVILALAPVTGMAVFMFRWYAVKQMLICLAGCLAAEALFTVMRRRRPPLTDLSAGVTGLILGLSLPATAPWYVGLIASVTAIGVGKTIFGGLGMNLFNPAMVGRAFVMIAFAGLMAAGGFEDPASSIDAMTRATPLTAFKQSGVATPLVDLFLGFTNGCPGEISAFACLLGGLYLCLRRTASWEIPAGVIIAAFLVGGLSDLLQFGWRMDGAGWTVLHHLGSGALMFGAFFIATDPVTSPLSPRGKLVFGVGVGLLVMVLRLFSGYPEGVMFAVLIMNALTPLINRVTRPKTMGES